MLLQERIQKTEKIIDSHNNLLGSDINSFRQLANVHSLKEIDERLESMKNNQRQLRIGIIGRMKAGKSSLLNALFFEGLDVLPSAVTPMTAALTTLNYGAAPAATVEFFSEEELETFRRRHADHEAAIKKKEQMMEERRRQMPQTKQFINKASVGKNMPPTREDIRPDFRNLAIKEANKEDPDRAAAWDLWEIAKKAGTPPQNEEKINCNTIADLHGKLGDYVGARGKLTPFTKCLHLELPFEQLKDLCVVDTPGLNDPVPSREARTQKELKNCDAVFIVSAAGQFLNDKDEALMERLSKTEGVRVFYIIVSQFDTQLFGNEYEIHHGNLEKVIESQKSDLEGHAKDVLAAWGKSHPVLASLAADVEKNFRISSGAAHSLLQDQKNWDETALHLNERLKDKYTDYFSDRESQDFWLKKLSGIPCLNQDISDVRGQKEAIFKDRINDYLNGQDNACEKWIQSLTERAKEKQHEFESLNMATIEEEIRNLDRITRKGSETANEAFSDQIEEISLSTRQEIRAIIRNCFMSVNQEAESSKGTTTERREKDGFCAWVARMWDGGYEYKTVETIKTKPVRDAIVNFRDFLLNELGIIIERKNIDWRNKIPKGILAQLRAIIDDDLIDNDGIRRVTRSILLQLGDLPSPVVPELPDKLSETGELRSWRADEFMKAAEKYLETLREVGNEFSTLIASRLKKIQSTPVGNQIFEALRAEAESKKLQLQTERLTAEQYRRLLQSLQELA